MHTLVQWLTARSGKAANELALPEVRRVDRETLLAKAFAYQSPGDFASRAHPRVRGLYDDENRIIYIDKAIDLSSAEGQAVLLHELVHHLQFAAGHQTHTQCINQLEPAAYKIEAEYLASHEQALELSIGEIRRLSRCS